MFFFIVVLIADTSLRSSFLDDERYGLEEIVHQLVRTVDIALQLFIVPIDDAAPKSA